MTDTKTILSGIQPSGNLHIGNYIGAMKQWLDIQREHPDNKMFFMVVDLHAITVPQDPHILRQSSLDLVTWFLASGLDAQKSTIFIQSDNPDHAYLTWILDCITPMGWMERMIQFKDKSKKTGERTSVGLFHYPSLMTADILLYDTDYVPVGDDQIQHLELTRDIAKKFNKIYGEIFTIPRALVKEENARIMSLQDPYVKMSKSDPDQKGIIYLSDSNDDITLKIQRAVTDSDTGIRYDPQHRPAISNLIAIFSAFSGKNITDVAETYTSASYVDFKNDLAEIIIQRLEPIRKKHNELIQNGTYVHKILDEGIRSAQEISAKKLEAVRKAVGILR